MPNFCLRCSIGRCYFPQRWIMVIICLVGVIVCYGQKFSLKMALDFYMKNKTSRKTSRLQVYSARSQLQLFNGSIHDAALKPQWSHKQETLIVSSFFIGYSLFNVPAGLMSDRISPKYLLGLGILTSSIGTMMVPVSVQYIAWWVTLLIRISMGIGQSSLLPAISTLIARWIPKGEQTFAMSFIVSGNLLGITLSFLLTNKIVICTGSWTTGFYFWGLLGVAWYLFCLTYIRSSPENHNYICEKELDFLNENMRARSKNIKIPWQSFFRDLGIWALFVAEIGHDFTLYALITNMPKYMSDVIKYELHQNLLASSLPYLCQWLSGVIGGVLVDYLVQKKGYDILILRKILTTIGLTLPSIIILVGCYYARDPETVVILFSINLLAKGFLYCGLKVNHLDITANFPGLILAMTNGFGSMSGFLSPYILSTVAPENTVEQWHVVFWIVFLTSLVTNIFYLIFAKGHRAKWDYGPDEMDLYQSDTQKREEVKAAKKEAKIKKKEDKKRAKAQT